MTSASVPCPVGLTEQFEIKPERCSSPYLFDIVMQVIPWERQSNATRKGSVDALFTPRG